MTPRLMVAALATACASFPVEPHRVWTGTGAQANFPGTTLSATDGQVDDRTLVAVEQCAQTGEDLTQPRTPCGADEGLYVFSADTPSGAVSGRAVRFASDPAWPGRAWWAGDLDGDGREDLAAMGIAEETPGMWVFREVSGSPGVGDAWAVLPDVTPQPERCGDLDGNGAAELCLHAAEWPWSDLGVAYGPLDPADPLPAAFPDLGVGVESYGDLDGDGDDDLVATDDGGHRLVALTDLSGQAPPDPARAWVSPDWSPVGLATGGDLDWDGGADVFLFGEVFPGSVLVGPTGGELSSVVTSSWAPPRGSDGVGAAIGDLDGDGVGDLVVASQRRDHPTYRGLVELHLGPLAPGRFGEADADLLLEVDGFSSEGMVRVADVDGDGRDDLLVGAPYDDRAGEDAGALYLWRGRDLVR
jgi:hypothetical protein